jgi:hypothetical protein
VTSPPCSSTSAFLCDGSVWNHFAMVYTGAQVLSYRNGMPLSSEVAINTVKGLESRLGTGNRIGTWGEGYGCG